MSRVAVSAGAAAAAATKLTNIRLTMCKFAKLNYMPPKSEAFYSGELFGGCIQISSGKCDISAGVERSMGCFC